MVGVILAAGNGTRMEQSIGENGCKALKKVNDTYLIEFALNNLIKLNIKYAFIVVGKHYNLIKNTIGYKYKSLNISYVYQAQPKGLMNALMQALSMIDPCEDIVLQLADEILFNLKAENILNICCDVLCGFTYEENIVKIKNNYSVEIDENLFVKKCTEKPSVITNNIKGTGFCVFKKDALQFLKCVYDEATNTPDNLCDYINLLISNNRKVLAVLVAEKEYNINTIADLEEAKVYLCSHQ